MFPIHKTSPSSYTTISTDIRSNNSVETSFNSLAVEQAHKEAEPVPSKFFGEDMLTKPINSIGIAFSFASMLCLVACSGGSLPHEHIIELKQTTFKSYGDLLTLEKLKATLESLEIQLIAANNTKSSSIREMPITMVALKDIKKNEGTTILGTVKSPVTEKTDKLEKINENTQSRLGSVSKSLTAVLVFAIGLDVNSTLGDYLNSDELQNFSDPEKAKKITIAQLLSHRSGLQENMQQTGDGQFGSADKENVSLAQRFLQEGQKNKFTFPNKEGEYHYSNLGYGIVGLILEKTQGKNILDLFSEYVFDPIGMTRTTRIFLDENHLPSFDDGKKNANGDRDFETDSFNTTAGGFRSCLKDMTLFSTYLYEINEGHKTLGKLDKNSFVSMIKPFPGTSDKDKNNYGMGFNNDSGKIGHNGMNGSYLSTFNLDLNTGKTANAFVNAMKLNGDPDRDSIIPVVKDLFLRSKF